MIFKNSNVVIIQSPFQVKIYSQYSEDTFVDGTFSTAHKNKYLKNIYICKYSHLNIKVYEFCYY